MLKKASVDEAIADLRLRAGDACRRVEQAFLPRASVGLVIGAESICAAHVVADADGRRVEEIRTEALPVRLLRKISRLRCVCSSSATKPSVE